MITVTAMADVMGGGLFIKDSGQENRKEGTEMTSSEGDSRHKSHIMLRT